MTEINDRSRLLTYAYLDRQDLRHIRNGTKAMRNAGTTYLPQHGGESDEQYAARLRSSVLHNITGRIIDVLTSRPFKKKAFIQSKDEDIFALNTNFDGTGETFTDFARTLFQEGLWDSQAHVLVDFQEGQKDINGNVIYSPNQKHRARVLNNDDILHPRYNEETGELIYFRFKDYKTVANEFDDDIVEVITEFRKENGKVYFRKTEGAYIENDQVFDIVDNWKEYGLPYIPLISFYPKPPKVKFRPNLIFQPMAELNITHWQSYSEQRNALKFARIPILFFKGIDMNDGQGAEIKIGSSFAIATSQTGADGKYIETTGSAIKDGRDDVLDLEQKMQALGFELLAKRQGVQTATGASLDMESTNSMLGCFAVSLKETLRRIIEVICDWYGIEADFEVNLETKFQIDYNDEKIRTLLEIWKTGGIKTEAFLTEMKKHGVLHDDADIDLIMGLAGMNEQF